MSTQFAFIEKIKEFYLNFGQKTQIFSINPMGFEKDITGLIVDNTFSKDWGLLIPVAGDYKIY